MACERVLGEGTATGLRLRGGSQDIQSCFGGRAAHGAVRILGAGSRVACAVLASMSEPFSRGTYGRRDMVTGASGS